MELILGFEDYQQPARNLAEQLNVEYALISVHHFPDGESKVTLPAKLPSRVIICRSLNNPNDKLIELILAAECARNLGVKSLILVAPYLCYMRQDIAFNQGEAVSQKIIGKLLADYFDSVITVDPHLHRISRLSQAIPANHAISLTATKPMCEFLSQRFDNPVLLGPDQESEQWVSAIAKECHWESTVAVKQRLGDTRVSVTLQSVKLNQRDVIIVDDIASTGKTLEKTVELIQRENPASISIIVTHAFFVNESIERLGKVGVTNIWSSDSIIHPTNCFSLIPMLKNTLQQLPT